ncbi:MAG: uroporphyrinogen-III C-methyltransferase [Actinomycetota bacterium]|nr:uroporphyrinogen-III C-methyltransferase [Actinomycetota bacterium]
MTVYLVGAGPGDPGLLTVRAAEVLAGAGVVVHDRLAEASVVDLAPPTARRIDVGKAPGGPIRQDSINELLVSLATEHATVVRLKGGDPFVFGRGGEEALALSAAGVDFEVIPGVTSAVAVAAYAGVPVTHRGLSTSFTVVTGHRRDALDPETDWSALAAVGGTIVVLMGVAHRGEIAQRLRDAGMDPATPVTAVQWGTRPEQRTIRTTLAQLGDAVVHPPATMVIGAVASLDLAWYERRPLLGRRVVVTRSTEQASGLVKRLASAGARAVEVPTIAVAEPADGGAALARAGVDLAAGRYDWVVFTSVNAVDRLGAVLRDARAFAGCRIAAIGPGTAAALAGRHLIADLVPQRAIAEGLLAAWPPRPEAGGRVLLPRAAVARDALPDGLVAAGWRVDVVDAYRTVPREPSADQRSAVADADAICFTSSSTVTNYLETLGTDRVPPTVACIGPVTAATARRAGLTVTTVAARHTVPGLVDALIAALS